MKSRYVFGLLLAGGLTMAGLARADMVTGQLSTGITTGLSGVVIAVPAASPVAGTYTSTQSVILSADGSTSIRYTTDGTTPTCSSGISYTGAIAVASSLTIQAVSCYPHNTGSSVASFAYVINPPVVTPTVSGGGGGGGGGFTPSVVTPVSSTISSSTLPQGEVLGASTTMAHVDGTLVQDGNTIYLIQNGQLDGFRDPQEFASYGYQFSQAVPINEADKLLPAGPVLKAMTGTLALDTSDNRTIYMVGRNSTKRGFASWGVFSGLGYVKGSSTSAGPVNGIYKINMSDYPAGAPITSAADPHPEGSLVVDSSGTVWWILNGQRDGFESMQVFQTYGFSFNRVVPANAADLVLPMGPLVKFRDGTLISDGGVTYIISDGQKLAFASAEAFARLGYDQAEVITAVLANYPAGQEIQ